MLEKILQSTYRCWVVNNGQEKYFQNDSDISYAELLKPVEKENDETNN